MRLHYLEWGDAGLPTALLLHGIGDNAHVWDRFASTVGDLRVVALDQRGHGESDWADPPAYGCDDYVGDVFALEEALGLTRLILMGHSMGALHATKYAAVRPDRVAALIHVDIEPRPPQWNKDYLRGLSETLPHAYQSAAAFVRQAQKNSPYADQELLLYLAGHALRRDPNGSLRTEFDSNALRHFDDYDLRPCLRSIECPTLIIRGQESRVMRREVAQEMSRFIRNSILVEIPNATHPVHTDNPNEFLRVVRRFLRNLGFS
jgi:pimeloyl-ACP methyl ester carboxylesterase